MSDPTERLRAGLRTVDPILARHGFVLTGTRTGLSLGGTEATATYARGDKRVELVVRATLDEVRYSIDDISIAHDRYLHHLGLLAAFPGADADPTARFDRLATDLPLTLTHFASPIAEQELDRARRAR